MKVAEDVSPNLIPMIDIMFLLLLFFMLGADMGQRELEEVRLPRAESARRDDGKQQRHIINVYHSGTCAAYDRGGVCREEPHWAVALRGRDLAEIPPFGDAIVMIRADRAAPYGIVQRVMNACAEGGTVRIECGASRR